MKRAFARWAINVWYKNSSLGILLRPFACIFYELVRIRRYLYRKGILKSYRLPVPVIIVGNITVGGTGKTPLTIWLAQLLMASGYQPGIISRGYGGKSDSWPQIVNEHSDVKQVGDEAVLMAKQSHCPIVVGPLRVASAQLLIRDFTCNIILSDDGLQHYRLQRDLEIAVVDGERRFGNGYCLPAGPLREPVERLNSVDLVLVNGEKTGGREFSMQLLGNRAINMKTEEQKPLSAFQKYHCHAVAGTGNPGRFFKLLASAGLSSTNHIFPDHYAYGAEDLDFNDANPVLMTEKDAVKCTQFADDKYWYVPVNAVPEPAFRQRFLDLLTNIKHDR